MIALSLLAQFLLVKATAQQADTAFYDRDVAYQDTLVYAPDSVRQEGIKDGDDDYDDYDDSDVVVESVPAKDRFLDRSAPGNWPYSPRGMTPQQKSAQKADKDYWYADYDFSKPKPKPEEPGHKPWWAFLDSEMVQTILWIIIIAGFATVLILYLRNNNISLFRNTKKIGSEEVPDDGHNDIFAINYDQEINKAAEAGNYRLATRLLFLRLLRTMSDRQVINYKQDSTNMDYLLQLAGSPLYKEFFQLARAYEYIWYGEFSIEGERYNLLRSEFDTLTRKITQP